MYDFIDQAWTTQGEGTRDMPPIDASSSSLSSNPRTWQHIGTFIAEFPTRARPLFWECMVVLVCIVLSFAAPASSLDIRPIATRGR